MNRINYSWLILAAGFAILFFSGGSRFAFGLMLKPMSEELEVSRSTLSLAVTMFMVVSAVAMPFVGRLVDRWSLRGTIAVGAVIGAAGLALMGQVQYSWQVFLVYGVVYALGNSGTSIAPVVVMVSQWFVQRRGVATSVAVSGNAIGQLIIVAALASALAAIGWQASFTVLAIVNAAILLPVILLVVRPGPPTEEHPSPGAAGSEPAPQPLTLRQALSSRPYLLLVAIYTICGFQDFFVATHIVAFAQDQGVGDVLAGNLLAWMGRDGTAGRAGGRGDGRRLRSLAPDGAVFRDANRHIRAYSAVPGHAGDPGFRAALRLHVPDNRSADGGVPEQHLRPQPAGNVDRHRLDDPPDYGRLGRIWPAAGFTT